MTNDTGLVAEALWRTYRSRANEQNCIKEFNEGYGWHKLGVHSFWCTEAAMPLLGMVCYNLIHYLNRTVPKTARSGLVRPKTLRLRVLAIPAQYDSGGRQLVLRPGVVDRSLRGQIRYWPARINHMSLSLLNCNAIGRLGKVRVWERKEVLAMN